MQSACKVHQCCIQSLLAYVQVGSLTEVGPEIGWFVVGPGVGLLGMLKCGGRVGGRVMGFLILACESQQSWSSQSK